MEVAASERTDREEERPSVQMMQVHADFGDHLVPGTGKTHGGPALCHAAGMAKDSDINKTDMNMQIRGHYR